MAVLTYSTTLLGIEALKVEVETEVIIGLKRFSIVGLPDGVVKEAKDRVKCAIENSGFEFPQSEVIVSLGPATLPKIGSGFDLAIALSILAANSSIPQACLMGKIFVGELALDGRIKATGGELASAYLVNELKQEENLFVSTEARNSLEYFPEFNVNFVTSLSELIGHVMGKIDLPISAKPRPVKNYSLKKQKSYSDVVGQGCAKRALQVAAAGGHNVLMVGPPGGGKTMLAERIISILPDLNKTEFLEVNKIHSVSMGHHSSSNGYKPKFSRQFRAPHHSVSMAGLIGGGAYVMPGEITLAHHGVLFLDEFPEMRRDTLEALREPLERRKISISRAQTKFTFPSNFILLAAMNPCPCGLRGVSQESDGSGGKYKSKCKCKDSDVQRYVKKISGPLLDRMDLQLWIPQVSISEMQNRAPIEDLTAKLKMGVTKAREIQLKRFGSELGLNALMGSSELSRFCSLSDNSKLLLTNANKKFNLSARAYTKILKVARTIADLAESIEISEEHVAEALSYRLQILGSH